MLQKVVQPHRCTTFIFPIHKDAYRQEKAPQQSEFIIQIACDASICNVLW